MANDRRVMRSLIASTLMCGAVSLAAQDRAIEERKVEERKVVRWEVGNVEASENVPPITGAPFTADATTEFTQVLSDGNRIEQHYSTSIARDGRGRTRREQDMALVGPLSVLQLEKTIAVLEKKIAALEAKPNGQPTFFNGRVMP